MSLFSEMVGSLKFGSFYTSSFKLHLVCAINQPQNCLQTFDTEPLDNSNGKNGIQKVRTLRPFEDLLLCVTVVPQFVSETLDHPCLSVFPDSQNNR